MNKEKTEEKKEWQKPEIEDLAVKESKSGGVVSTETPPFGPTS